MGSDFSLPFDLKLPQSWPLADCRCLIGQWRESTASAAQLTHTAFDRLVSSLPMFVASPCDELVAYIWHSFIESKSAGGL